MNIAQPRDLFLDSLSMPHATAEKMSIPSSTGVTFLWILSEADDGMLSTLERYLEALAALRCRTELIIVNDGLGAEVNERLGARMKSSGVDARILYLHRHAGPSIALSTGCKDATGDVIVALPSYLQIDPAIFPEMISRVVSGELDYVCSWRFPRIDSKADARKSELFNKLTGFLTGVELHDINAGLKVFRRQVVEEVSVHGDLYRFLPILAARQGFKVGEIKVRHVAEQVKKGDYRFGVYLRRLLDLLTLFFLIKFTRKPLRFFGLLGSGVLLGGIILLLALVAQWVLGRPLGDRPLFVFGVLMIVLGAQLFSIGLLGELIIFTHARETKEYHIEKVYESDGK
jgi:glycosyltransferase involved in cell wall biosynthesis